MATDRPLIVSSPPHGMDRDGLNERSGKERPGTSLERRSPSRSKRGGLLIACGQRAGLYLTGLLHHLQLENRVTLSLSTAEDPLSILENGHHAWATLGPFRRVYVVVCHDTPKEDWHRLVACSPVGPTNHPIRFQKIASIPSFNLWLLLHWRELPPETWTHYDQLSAWVDDQLERYLPATAWCSPMEWFATVGHGLVQAIARGQQLSRQQGTVSTVLPMTNVHELASHLLKLHKESQRLQD